MYIGKSSPCYIVKKSYECISCAPVSSVAQKSLSWQHATFMMTSSNGNIFRVTGHLCGEFTGPSEFYAQRPVTRSFGVFLDLHPNRRLNKQWWGWWLETPSCPLWCQCIDLFRQRLGAEWATSHYLTQWRSSSLTHICVTRHHCVKALMKVVRVFR